MPGPSRPRRLPRGAVVLATVAAVGGAVLYGLRPELVVNLATNPRAIAVAGGFGLVLLALYLVLRRVGAPAAVRAVAVGLPLIAFLAWTLVPAFRDVRVDDTLPGAAVEAGATAAPPEAAASDAAVPPTSDAPQDTPVEVAAGDLSGRNDYRAEGRVRLLSVPDAGALLRLEDLDASNGPDLRVYLTRDDPDPSGRTADFVDLGALKGNQGNQNYDVADDVDLDQFRSVVIWCRVADAAFGVAALR